MRVSGSVLLQSFCSGSDQMVINRAQCLHGTCELVLNNTIGNVQNLNDKHIYRALELIH